MALIQNKSTIIILIVFLAVLIFIVGPLTKNLGDRLIIPKNENNENWFSDNKNGCVSNQNPVFSHYITDMSKVKMIVPPGSIETYQGEKIVKSHSYVLVNEQVPVYAPADGILVEGAHYIEEGNVYYLHFQVSCEVTYRFDHILNPIQAIKDALPAEPSLSTHTSAPKDNIEVKAGQLIGYSVPSTVSYHGIWFDFGVVNTAQAQDLSNLENQGVRLDERDYQSVCPYDFFPKEMREKYYTLFGNYKDSGIVPTLYCK